MKTKICLLIIIVLTIFNTTLVYAEEDLIIEDLLITNGVLSPGFDKYNNYYSVTIDEDTKELDMSYIFDEDKYEVNIANNYNLVENQFIYVTVLDKENEDKNTYILKVFVEETETTASIVDDNKIVEEQPKENTNYAPIVGTACFILIILVYYFIFLR